MAVYLTGRRVTKTPGNLEDVQCSSAVANGNHQLLGCKESVNIMTVSGNTVVVAKTSP